MPQMHAGLACRAHGGAGMIRALLASWRRWRDKRRMRRIVRWAEQTRRHPDAVSEQWLREHRAARHSYKDGGK